MQTIILYPQWPGPGTKFQHTWAPIANIDQFRWLSRANTLRQPTAARDELGVRHVRAGAMYSPEMAVWDYNLSEWQNPADEKSKSAN